MTCEVSKEDATFLLILYVFRWNLGASVRLKLLPAEEVDIRIERAINYGAVSYPWARQKASSSGGRQTRRIW